MERKILFQCEGVVHFVCPRDILFLKADGSYTLVALKDRDAIRLSKNLSHVYQMLPIECNYFFRVGRSWVINMDHVRCIVNRDNRVWVHMVDGTKIDLINVNMRKRLLNRYLIQMDQVKSAAYGK
jgi:DNA-binding LytR/AlgR family response regulator